MELDGMTVKAIEVIAINANGSKKVLAEITCIRCSGHGRLENFRQVDGGICFKCDGTGVEKKELTVKQSEEVVMIQETTAIKPLRKINDDEAMRNSMLQTNAERKEKREKYKELLRQDEELRRLRDENMEKPYDFFS